MAKETKTTTWTNSTPRWTNEEIVSLKRIVRESSSKTEAFKEFSKSSGRPFPGVCAKFYSLGNKKEVAKKEVAKKGVTKKSKDKIDIKNYSSTFKFQIENDWMPTKLRTMHNDDFIMSIVKTADNLKPLQSFAIPYKEMNQRYGWKEASCSSAIRHLLKKIIPANSYGKIQVHEVKDHNKKLVQIRVRRANEAL